MDDQRETPVPMTPSLLARAQAEVEHGPPATPKARALTAKPVAETSSAAAAAEGKRGRRLPLLLIACLVLTGAGYVGWQWWTDWRFVESTDDAYLHADMSVISPEVAGYIRSVQVTDNQRVAAGDVLALIDDRDYGANLAAAKAEFDARKADVVSAEREIDLQQSLIAQAEAAVASTDADLVQARQDHDRYTALAKQDFTSRQRLETATAALKRAEAAESQSQAAVAATVDRLPVLRAARDKAKAGVAAAEASLTTANINLARTTIRAPIDGVVGNKGVQVGDYVQPGRQLMAVVPLQSVYVVANFKETQLAAMQPGQVVTVEVDAFPDQPLEGRLDSFAPATGAQFSLLPPENATGNFTKIVQRVPVRITLPADGPLAGRLRPGLSVVASIDTKDAAEAPSVGMIGHARAQAPDQTAAVGD